MERDDLIKVARSLYENPLTNDALKKVLEENYPELKESEDERIRKEILALVKKHAVNHERCKMEDYLGKVKEQKPAECLKAERDGWYVCIKDYYRCGKKLCSVGDLVQAKGGMRMMGEDDISEWFRRAYYEEVRDALKPDTDANISEKHAEWSEKDKYILKNIHDFIKENTINPNRVNCAEECLNWLKSLRQQPKVELSEKEMKVLDSIIDDYEKAVKSFCGYDGKIALLKAIRNSEYDLSKQEWSVEDKDIINEVAFILINDENRAENKGEEDRLAYLPRRKNSIPLPSEALEAQRGTDVRIKLGK